MKYLILILLTTCFNMPSSIAQNSGPLEIKWYKSNVNLHFGERFLIGNSVSYLSDSGNAGINYYHEFVWSKDVSMNINKWIYVGISHKNIFTSGSTFISNSNHKESYYMVGAFSAIDFFPSKRFRFYIELSLNSGNYCTCIDERLLIDGYKKDGLIYFGSGGGITVPIKKWVSFEVAINSYITTNNKDDYGFAHYKLGLNIDIIRNKRLKVD